MLACSFLAMKMPEYFNLRDEESALESYEQDAYGMVSGSVPKRRRVQANTHNDETGQEEEQEEKEGEEIDSEMKAHVQYRERKTLKLVKQSTSNILRQNESASTRGTQNLTTSSTTNPRRWKKFP